VSNSSDAPAMVSKLPICRIDEGSRHDSNKPEVEISRETLDMACGSTSYCRLLPFIVD
jgi:hypothetical protein